MLLGVLMPSRRIVGFLVLCSCCLFVASSFPAFHDNDGRTVPQTATDILLQAERLTDIRSGDALSFRLNADVEAYDDKGKQIDGKYFLLWNSPTIWREEIVFGDRSEVRLARMDKLLISRKPPSPSEQIYRIARLMDFPSLLSLRNRDQIEGMRERTKDGQQEKEIAINVLGDRPWKKVYLDGSALVPLSIEYKGAALGAHYPYKDFDLKFQFADYMKFQDLQFPRTLRRFDSSVLKDQVVVKEWSEAKFGESDFVPPDDSHWIRWCPHAQQPQLESRFVDRLNNALPPQLRTGGPPSRVIIYGVVGTDGLWHNLEAVKSEGSMVDSFWMNHMRRQKFTPAKCGDTPVEYETMTEFDYP
jgi:hypothetical protein